MVKAWLSVLAVPVCNQHNWFGCMVFVISYWKLSTLLTFCLYLCVRAGPPTSSPGTGPVPPSSLWPVTPRLLVRLTCTAAYSPSCTRSLPTTCGQRTSTCVSTLPWIWVRLDFHCRCKNLLGCDRVVSNFSARTELISLLWLSEPWHRDT